MMSTQGSNRSVSNSANASGVRSSGAPPIFVETDVHPFLNFKSSEETPFKATFESKQGYTYGIEMVNQKPEDRINLLELERDGLGFDPYTVIEQSFN